MENGLHWSLDVIFREDSHRYQQRVGAANLSLMRKRALAALSRDKTTKCGRATRQVKALASASYRDHLLKIVFNARSPGVEMMKIAKKTTPVYTIAMV